MKVRKFFNHVSRRIALFTGSPAAFILAFLIVVSWFIGGIFVGFGSTIYQLLINTGTTIITFLMVFLIQNSQNTDTLAMELKLDELIRSQKEARNTFIGLEDREGDIPEEVKNLQKEFDDLEKEEIEAEK